MQIKNGPFSMNVNKNDLAFYYKICQPMLKKKLLWLLRSFKDIWYSHILFSPGFYDITCYFEARFQNVFLKPSTYFVFEWDLQHFLAILRALKGLPVNLQYLYDFSTGWHFKVNNVYC